MATSTETPNKGHRLVHTIQAVLEKRAKREELEQVLESSRHGLEQQLQDFHQTVDGLRAETREKVTGLIEAADETFTTMEGALQDIATYLQSGDENLLYGAGSTVHRGTEQLNFIFNELRNFVLSVEGPTPYANLNLLIRAHEVFVPGKDEKGERLKEFVQTERLMALDALDQIEGAELTPELQALKEVWDQHLRCMNRLFMAVEKGDKATADKEMEVAKTSFTRLAERVPSASMSTRYDGPTRSKQVNLALSLAQDVEQMRIHDAPLVEALQLVHQNATETKADLEQVLDAQVDSVLLREEVDRAMTAVELQLEALAEFAEFFDNREALVLRSASHKLAESADALTNALDKLGELADRENKTVCIRCGHYNVKGRNNCEKCSAPLPNLGQQSSSTFETGESQGLPLSDPQRPVVTTNLLRLYKAVDGIYDGTLDADAYLAEIDWYQSVIDENSEYEIEEPHWDELGEEERAQAEEAYKAMEEVQELFAQGVLEMNESLERLRSYVDTQDKSDLEEGVKLMDSGARKVAAVRDATMKQKQ